MKTSASCSHFCRMRVSMHCRAVTSVLIVAAPILVHSQVRHEEAHEHGVSTLNMAIEGAMVSVQLSGPMVNFVGFEHVPDNEEEESALEQAVSRLNDSSGLLTFNAQANCSIEGASVMAPDPHAADAHSHDDHDEHEEHASHDDHDDHADSPEAHLDIEASYEFHCENAELLTYVDVGVFSVFPQTESIEAQVLGASSVVVEELTPGKERLPLQD